MVHNIEPHVKYTSLFCKLHSGVICLLDRYFSDDVALNPIHQQVASFFLNDHVEVRLYEDAPMFLALFCMDGIPILKENLIDDRTVTGYIDRTITQKHLLDFIQDYAA